MCGLVKGHLARHADRTARLPGLNEAHHFTILDEMFRRGGGRGHFAAVKYGNLVLGAVVIDHERAAADAGAFRLDKAQNRVNGNRRINRAATIAHHFKSGLNRQGVGGRDHGTLGPAQVSGRRAHGISLFRSRTRGIGG